MKKSTRPEGLVGFSCFASNTVGRFFPAGWPLNQDVPKK